jgi:hypothetical protein
MFFIVFLVILALTVLGIIPWIQGVILLVVIALLWYFVERCIRNDISTPFG